MDKNGNIRQIGPPDEIYEKPADSFVFKFMGVSNFIPLDYRDGKVYVSGSESVMEYPVPKDQTVALREGSLVAGCRPQDIQLSTNETHLRGLLKRAVYLGSTIDYRISVGETEIRVQQDIQEALAENRIYKEGDKIGLRFLDMKWFARQEVDAGEGVS